MLILERKKGQSLLIGDNIKITIGKVGGNKVEFITKAPKEIKVMREEIYTKDAD